MLGRPVVGLDRSMCAAASASAAAGPMTAAMAKQRLQEHEVCRLVKLSQDRPKPSRPSAVLIPLFMNHADKKLSVLLTQRSSALRHHSGEVAFPGGRFEEGDENPAATALREAREEVGLQPHQVEVCTELPVHLARGRHCVVPVVAFVPENFQAVMQTSEVDAVFRAPLEMFLSSELHSSYQIEVDNMKWNVHSFDYVDPEHDGRSFCIWGFTAQLLITVASIVFNRSPNFKAVTFHYCKDVPGKIHHSML